MSATIPDVRHFLPACAALRAEDDVPPQGADRKRCEGCGVRFQIARRWQKYCSNRCRVRVQRMGQLIEGYYGA